MSRCFVALGGNLGTVDETFQRAYEQLSALARIKIGATSNTFRTPAVGSQAGNDFVNATVELFTDLEPLELLDELQLIENVFGRTRERRWGPRTLDLDMLLYSDQSIVTDQLTLPHPRLHERAFVLYPLSEIAPDLVIPGHGRVLDLLNNCKHQRITRLAGQESKPE